MAVWCVLGRCHFHPPWSYQSTTEYWLKDSKLRADDDPTLDQREVADRRYHQCSIGTATKSLPHTGGLQFMALGEMLAFDVQRGEFVQVLNVVGCHWVTVSNLGCCPEVVNLYDSSHNYTVSTEGAGYITEGSHHHHPHPTCSSAAWKQQLWPLHLS